MRDLATDARAAVDALRSRPNVDASRVGLVGHSEGGLIAAMVANEVPAVDFVALLAAPGLPGDEVLAGQLDRRARASGIDRRTRAAQRGTQQRIFDVLKQDADSAAVAAELRKIMIDTRGIDGEEMIRSEIRRLMDPGLRFFLRYDPAEALRQLDEPVLAVIGSKDTHLDPKKNLDAIREALGNSPSTNVTVRRLDGLNHLLQPAQTGTPAEYGRIEQTVAPEALDLVTSWIARHAGVDTTR
jgi:pimeloyl-ACP methyl ester carboxylesterase